MPRRSLADDLELTLVVNVIDAEPLDVVPPPGAPPVTLGGSADPTRRRLTAPQVPPHSGASSRSLSPRRRITKLPPRNTMPGQNPTGQLALKGAMKEHDMMTSTTISSEATAST